MLVTLMAPQHSPFLENKLLQNLKRLNAQAIQLHRFPKKDGIFPWVFPGSLLFFFGFAHCRTTWMSRKEVDGSMVNGSMGYFTYLHIGYELGLFDAPTNLINWPSNWITWFFFHTL